MIFTMFARIELGFSFGYVKTERVPAPECECGNPKNAGYAPC